MITIREAGLADIPSLLHHRRGMYEAMGYNDPETLSRMTATCEPYFRQALADGTFLGWLAVTERDEVVAGGGIVISPWPSHPYDLQIRKPTILNVFVEPEYRRQGIARRLMQTMIDWCRAQGFPHVSLHASDEGRPLYESLGFKPTTEMRLKLTSPENG